MGIWNAWEMRNAYTVFVGKPEWKRALDRPKRRWGFLKISLKEIGYDVED
jgi:hypothetical protein